MLRKKQQSISVFLNETQFLQCCKFKSKLITINLIIRLKIPLFKKLAIVRVLLENEKHGYGCSRLKASLYLLLTC